MGEHPIENLMLTAMDSIRDMIDVNTIIGETIESNNITIIPISKVSFGFAAGGSEFKTEAIGEYKREEKGEEEIKYKLPFGGGSGAGVSISPVGFLTVDTENKYPRFIPVEHKCSIDKLLEYIPDLFEKVENMICKKNEQNATYEDYSFDKESIKQKNKTKPKTTPEEVKDKKEENFNEDDD